MPPVEPSFWEIRSFATWDFVIVGAGITGLSTALSLRARHPRASILVLERDMLPTGASTRNAGFACYGSPTELLVDLDAMGPDATVALVARRAEGLRRLTARLGPDGLGLRPSGGYELLPAARADVPDRLAELNGLLRDVFPSAPFLPADDRLPAFGFPADRVRHLVACVHEAAIDPGKMMRSLLRACAAADIPVWTGAEVLSLDTHADHVTVTTSRLTLRAGRVGLCTNAFTRTLLPDLALQPGRGQVLVTEPVPDLPWTGVFHLDEGYVYFRDIDGHVVLGGARNLDVEGETTTEFGLSPHLQAHLERLLREVVLPGRAPRIVHRWSGIMAFGPERTPVLRSINPRIAAAVRLGGMGVALGTLLGDELATVLEAS